MAKLWAVGILRKKCRRAAAAKPGNRCLDDESGPFLRFTAFMCVLWLTLPATAAAASGCDVRETLGFCYEYSGSKWTTGNARLECATASGSTFLESGCPGAGRVGSCRFQPGDRPAGELLYIYYHPTSLRAAARQCRGRFNPQ